jgi:DNA-binding transcriptional LysR family regulator
LQVLIGHSGNVARAVACGDADIGIAGPTRRPPGIHGEPLLLDELVWIAPRQHALPGVLTAPVLRQLSVIVAGRESSTRRIVERSLEDAGCRPARLLELDSVEAVKRAVRCGVGVAAVSRLSVAAELSAGDLREVELLGAEPSERVVEIVRKEHRKPTPLELAFEHALRLSCESIRFRDETHPKVVLLPPSGTG